MTLEVRLPSANPWTVVVPLVVTLAMKWLESSRPSRAVVRGLNRGERCSSASRGTTGTRTDDAAPFSDERGDAFITSTEPGLGALFDGVAAEASRSLGQHRVDLGRCGVEA
mmetsp:Transcript_27033/g.62469  ORF Transcript_27033/g.62469 Transcript_27033/m.62469 type:complete len:111 (+) Transcript_27033:2794-3126(+)